MTEKGDIMGKEDRIDCCMKREVIYGHPGTTVREAAVFMAENGVETLPVVNEGLELVGMTTMRDVIRIFLPDFVSLLSNIGFVKDYGDLDTPSQESMRRVDSLLVAEIMRKPVSVEDDCTLIRALSLLHKHRIPDLAVVKDGRLVGIASRLDVGRAFLSTWLISQNA